MGRVVEVVVPAVVGGMRENPVVVAAAVEKESVGAGAEGVAPKAGVGVVVGAEKEKLEVLAEVEVEAGGTVEVEVRSVVGVVPNPPKEVVVGTVGSEKEVVVGADEVVVGSEKERVGAVGSIVGAAEVPE